ncbi:putative alkaline shock family protein YloU [Desulfohalotomaculum tongense]|uniref:alkaline shock response membrane anchor protein AmaP n=1 Tax=Desulforadius tongensis TaxID=1216062 RepID=UPI0019588FB9|nr:putative alkaline shock family protein YloU [Desulforadius tongensis]
MGIFDRGLLAVYSLTVTVLLLISVLVLGGWWIEPLDIILKAPSDPENSTILWTIIAALVLAGLWLFYASLRRGREQRAVVQEYSLGQVRITMPAMEELVKKAAFKVEGVREIKPRIITSAGGISVVIKAAVAPDINIPEVSKHIQHQVKEYLLEITGISVHNVKIMVESISTKGSRVE